MAKIAVEPAIRWFFFNAILALLPLIIPFAAAKLMKVEAHWSKLLKDGELFIFSTTISASAIGALLFERMSPATDQASPAVGSLATTLTICSLMMILILSTAYFTIASYLKLKEQPLPDERRYSAGSVAAAVVSVLLGYFTYVQVG